MAGSSATLASPASPPIPAQRTSPTSRGVAPALSRWQQRPAPNFNGACGEPWRWLTGLLLQCLVLSACLRGLAASACPPDQPHLVRFTPVSADQQHEQQLEQQFVSSQAQDQSWEICVRDNTPVSLAAASTTHVVLSSDAEGQQQVATVQHAETKPLSGVRHWSGQGPQQAMLALTHDSESNLTLGMAFPPGARVGYNIRHAKDAASAQGRLELPGGAGAIWVWLEEFTDQDMHMFESLEDSLLASVEELSFQQPEHSSSQPSSQPQSQAQPGLQPHSQRQVLSLAESNSDSVSLVPTADAALASPASTRQKTIELMVVNDFLRFQEEGPDTAVMAAGVVNMADALFSRVQDAAENPDGSSTSAGGLQLRLMLVGQITFTREDPYQVESTRRTVAATALLSSFLEWFSSIAPSAGLPRSDSAFLLSGFAFQGNTVGVAPVGTMCKSQHQTGGVIQTSGLTSSQVGLIVAHELAHNLGVLHDKDPCPKSGYIMSSVQEGGRLPNSWSECSKDAIRTFLEGSGSRCLDDLPSRVWSADSCGDGVLNSPEEQCDCGHRNCSGIDDCCDGRACLLKSDPGCPLPPPIPTEGPPGVWDSLWSGSRLWTMGLLVCIGLLLVWACCVGCARKACNACRPGGGRGRPAGRPMAAEAAEGAPGERRWVGGGGPIGGGAASPVGGGIEGYPAPLLGPQPHANAGYPGNQIQV